MDAKQRPVHRPVQSGDCYAYPVQGEQGEREGRALLPRMFGKVGGESVKDLTNKNSIINAVLWLAFVLALASSVKHLAYTFGTMEKDVSAQNEKELSPRRLRLRSH